MTRLNVSSISANVPLQPPQGSREPLAVYVRLHRVPPLSIYFRSIAALIALAAFTPLYLATRISPDPRGIGTHQQLGLPPCGFMETFGLPCPSCGFTTSFSLFSHGHPLASLYNQPMGFLLAFAFAMTAWAALYIALTGRRLHRLFQPLFTPRVIFSFALVFLLAWAWKIALVKVAR